MEKITNVAELKDAIRELEHQHYIDEQFMRKRITEIAEELKPVNLLKNLFRHLIEAREVKANLVRMATGMVTGFVVKKLFGKKN
jgi:hypothetical protein